MKRNGISHRIPFLRGPISLFLFLFLSPTPQGLGSVALPSIPSCKELLLLLSLSCSPFTVCTNRSTNATGAESIFSLHRRNWKVITNIWPDALKARNVPWKNRGLFTIDYLRSIFCRGIGRKPGLPRLERVFRSDTFSHLSLSFYLFLSLSPFSKRANMRLKRERERDGWTDSKSEEKEFKRVLERNIDE